MESTYVIRRVSTHGGQVYQLYDFDKRQVVAQGNELALVKVNQEDGYIYGGSFVS
jgi:hypothetical protein